MYLEGAYHGLFASEVGSGDLMLAGEGTIRCLPSSSSSSSSLSKRVIQAGVGISSIYPIYSYGKIIMIIQQFIMIMTHVFTLYVFTL